MSVLAAVTAAEEHGGSSAADQLAAFLGAVSASEDVTAAMLVAAEHASAAFGAEAAVVTRGEA